MMLAMLLLLLCWLFYHRLVCDFSSYFISFHFDVFCLISSTNRCIHRRVLQSNSSLRKHYIHSLYFARYLCFDFCIKKSSKNIIYRLQTYTQYTHICVSADGHMQPVFCSKKKTRKREKTFHSIFMCAVCRFFTILPLSFVIFFS